MKAAKKKQSQQTQREEEKKKQNKLTNKPYHKQHVDVTSDFVVHNCAVVDRGDTKLEPIMCM